VSVGRSTLASPVLRRFRLVARGAPGKDQEQKAHEHGEIGSRVTDHEPESLSGSRQFGDFRRSDGGADDDQQWNRRQPCKHSEEHQQPTTNLECAHEVSRQGRVREADSREPVHAHVGIDKFEDTLREENQTDSDAYENRRCGKFCVFIHRLTVYRKEFAPRAARNSRTEI
jgi:hypothetical protein